VHKYCNLNKDWKKQKTAHNKRYTLRRLFGGSELRSARSFRYAPFPRRLTPPTFLQPWSCCASPYSGCKNVVYLERYVPFVNLMQNKVETYWQNKKNRWW